MENTNKTGKRRVQHVRVKLFAICLSLLICSALLACDEYDKVGTVNSGAKVFQVICVDGVEYLQRNVGRLGYFAGHFKPDGSLYTCDK